MKQHVNLIRFPQDLAKSYFRNGYPFCWFQMFKRKATPFFALLTSVNFEPTRHNAGQTTHTVGPIHARLIQPEDLQLQGSKRVTRWPQKSQLQNSLWRFPNLHILLSTSKSWVGPGCRDPGYHMPKRVHPFTVKPSQAPHLTRSSTERRQIWWILDIKYMIPQENGRVHSQNNASQTNTLLLEWIEVKWNEVPYGLERLGKNNNYSKPVTVNIYL